MFTTVRYFVKTSIIFLALGILTGLYMTYTKYITGEGFSYDIQTAHTHIILVGSVMMMIMGVAIWFFPRPQKDDKRYNPDLVMVVYWLMASATFGRFVFQMLKGFFLIDLLNILIAATSFLQVAAMMLFFHQIWGRIRPLGSQIREAKGEKF